MTANRAFYILLVSFCVSLVGLITILYKSLPLIIANAIYVCQKTFANAVTLPHSIPFTLSLIIVIVLIIGLLTLGIQILKTRLYIKRNLGKKVFVPETVKKIAYKLNLNDKIDIIKDKNKFSFCYGMIKPRICLSTGLIKKLNKNELKAVLLHESYHLKNNDPLKAVISQAASHMFFFVPTLRDIQKYYALSKEIAADKVATQMESKRSLLSALSKLMSTALSSQASLITLNTPKYAGVAGLASVDDLEKRIRFLAGEQNQASFRPSLFNLFLSITVILFSFIALTAPIHAISMGDQSMNTSYCVCPYYDDRCSGECKDRLKTNDINFSPYRLYSPAGGISE